MLHQVCEQLRRFSAPEGLWQGQDSVTQDFATNVWRMKVLGFNAVRLPFKFTDFEIPQIQVKHQCQVAPAVSKSSCSSILSSLKLKKSLFPAKLPTPLILPLLLSTIAVECGITILHIRKVCPSFSATDHM
jgi:hypothetical protein